MNFKNKYAIYPRINCILEEVLIASNITKIVDVIKTGCTSIKTLHKHLMLVEPHYIEQTPPQYMQVWMNLNFIAYIGWQTLGESFVYIEIHATSIQDNCIYAWMTITKPPTYTSPKPSKLLPHWHQVPKWKKKIEDQYSKSSSFTCAFLMIWVESNAHTNLYINWGAQAILGIHRMQQDDNVWP